jgi:hypothetical protein
MKKKKKSNEVETTKIMSIITLHIYVAKTTWHVNITWNVLIKYMLIIHVLGNRAFQNVTYKYLK